MKCLLVRIFRRRRWHPTPVLLPGKSHGWRSLLGCSPWGRKESDMTELLHFSLSCIAKEMATHSSVLAWRIPGTGEPGGLLSTGSHRVRTRLKQLSSSSIRDGGWRRQWHPTPVFLPGKSHRQRSLVGCSPWGHKESDTAW